MTIKQIEAEKRFKEKGLELISEYINTKKEVECKCGCGKTLKLKPRSVFYSNNEKKECFCSISYKYLSGKNNYLWKGCGDISSKLWKAIQYGAKTRNIDFKLSIEEAWDIFIQQEKKCALTKLPLQFAKNDRLRNDRTASLDRINPKGNYTKNNVFWVHKFINETKWDLSLDEYLYWCNLLHNPIKENSSESCVIYKHHKNFKGHGNLSMQHYDSIQMLAKQRGLLFDVTPKQLWELFISQNGRCSLTGVQLWFPVKNGDGRIASLDRINNHKGYFIGNIQWVHKIINYKLKKHLSQETLFWITKLVLDNYYEN